MLALEEGDSGDEAVAPGEAAASCLAGGALRGVCSYPEYIECLVALQAAQGEPRRLHRENLLEAAGQHLPSPRTAAGQRLHSPASGSSDAVSA